MRRGGTKAGKTRRGLGIQWRLLGYLGIFVLFMLVILWIFQVYLLNWFYERIKNQEMLKTERRIEEVIGDDEALERETYQCAMDYSICVQVWRVESNRARIAASADVSDDCIIHNVRGGDVLSSLYTSAKQNGGVFSTQVQIHSGKVSWSGADGSPHAEKRDPDQNPLQGGSRSALYTQIVQSTGGTEYVIFLDAELTPMNATVSTLKTQVSCIAVLMFAGALLLAFLMSRRISRPLVRMNAEARLLAKGRYDVQFSGNGYRETRELAQTLNYAAEELSKTDRLQKELVANISHDLRTPLTMIKGYSEVMRDIPGENTPENVQVIIDEATRLSELVNDMLDLSKIQSGTKLPKTEVFDLTETVRTVLTRYEKLTGHEGYSVSFEATEEAYIRADRSMMLQVIYNLINNAINYCGEDRLVIVRQFCGADWVRICVCDHGSGIPEEQIPLIWDRYYKVDEVHRRAMIGTGLGLSIVKGVLELHGAAYGVESRQGENAGSVFWFELPRVTAPAKGSEKDGGEKEDGWNCENEK